MDEVLNITNGDSAVTAMVVAGISGVFLPWRDVLHEGPVPADLPLEELSELRAQFIAGQGWSDRGAAREHFQRLARELNNYRSYSKVTLWFEHDLYDQLQILQILDWFADQNQNDICLKMVCVDQYLGLVGPDRMKELMRLEEDVSEAQLEIAKLAWAAFRSESPLGWQDLLNEDTSALRFLKGAVARLLEEYPDSVNGLSRTMRQAMKVIAQGERRPGRIFAAYQETEERRFLGDVTFWTMLGQLLNATPALLELTPGERLTLPASPDQELSITRIGRNVLEGKRSWLDIAGIDRWIGGVHLTPDNCWCWNSDKGTLERY
jgi:hypothetical protein